jgi:hypothetical protein
MLWKKINSDENQLNQAQQSCGPGYLLTRPCKANLDTGCQRFLPENIESNVSSNGKFRRDTEMEGFSLKKL